MKGYYHIYTKGLSDDVIFRDRSDYVAGMNYVPVSLLGLDVVVLAFTLMSNHVHFVVYGTPKDVVCFIETYKNLLGRYARRQYGVDSLLRRLPVGVSLIGDSPDDLKRIIAYVLNNPVAAGINCFPLQYEWGSGRYYFCATQNTSDVPLISIPRRRQIRMIRSCKSLCQNLLMTAEGYISPRSYIDVAYVERLFYRASSLNYFLSSSAKRPASLILSDGLLTDIVREILDKQYGGLVPDRLPAESRKHLVADLNRRLNSSPKQIARILNIPLPEVVSILKR
jgi:hypothetical protein